MTQNPKSGVEAVAEMMNLLDKAHAEKLLAGVAAQDPELAKKIRQRMFTFDDLLHVEGREMQLLIRELPAAKLTLSLRAATAELKAHFFGNMSARAAQLLQEDLAAQPPQRLSEVRAAQEQILEIARRLEGEGKILLKRPR